MVEEAAILPTTSELAHADVVALRAESASGGLERALAARGLRMRLDALVPFARWVTPAIVIRRSWPESRSTVTSTAAPSISVR